MEGRRKAPVRTYGKSKLSEGTYFASASGRKPDSFDLLFQKKSNAEHNYADDDPFAFEADEPVPAKSIATNKNLSKNVQRIRSDRNVKSKPKANVIPASVPRAVVKQPSSQPLPLFVDTEQKNDRQMKIDTFTVALPRLKATVTPVSPRGKALPIHHDDGEQRVSEEKLTDHQEIGIAAEDNSKTEEQPVEKVPRTTSPVQQRQIFTTARNERKKVSNPVSWFAMDDDEDEDLNVRHKPETSSSKPDKVDRQKPSVSFNKSISVSVDSATGKRSVRVAKSERDNYAVVKHVRGVSELQAEGSSLEYDGDFAYLSECLGNGSQLSSRCLSAFQLVTKCADSSDFRLYLKSTGKLTELFSKLEDADQYDLLGLCAAAIFLVLSSDRSQVDLDTAALSLLVRLVKLRPQSDSWSTAVTVQTVDRLTNGISNVLRSLQRKYGAEQFSFCPETNSPRVVSEMSLSALHTLSQRCSTESVQNQFREAGAIEILVNGCVSCLNNPDLTLAYCKQVKSLVSGISKLVTKNKQSKLLASEYENGALPRALAEFTCKLLPNKFESDCDQQVGELENKLLSQSYNLMMLLCCDAKSICGILSSECPDFVAASARVSLIGCQSKSLEAVHSYFDLSILAFFVLVNIFEYSPVAAAVSYPFGSEGPGLSSLLVEFFNFLYKAAADCEREADEQITSSQQAEQSDPNFRPSSSLGDKAAAIGGDDSALDAMLQAAGTRHMELNFLAACCCIIIFYAADADPKGIESIRSQFTGSSFDSVVDVLKRFVTFTALVNGADDKTLETVAKILEKFDCANKAAGFGGSSKLMEDDDDGNGKEDEEGVSEPKRPRQTSSSEESMATRKMRLRSANSDETKS